ncbi:hypothetical protein [Nocardia jinanensis]|uniref:ARB-07466-like C-terminal domain-containing protein n=2 Tax=Nocardia jinanensis TaxID=382504 RepID=A0A917RTQ3_9NOCA|nr:hypothetical protein [Nocardia jinanensis]GGL31012.1 hypothetical protein GCM10011588_52230 [Nocardia jinanensis]
MPGQHRKPARAKKIAPLAGSAIAATAAIALSMTARPGPAAQPAAAAVDSPAIPVGMGKATEEPAPATPGGLLPVAAVDRPQEPARYAKRHAPPPIPCSTELAGAQPQVAQVGNLIDKTFGIAEIGGANGRYDGEHGAGLALDFMTSDPARGDAIADFVLANKERFGVSYVIWQQRYNDGSGWSYMEDRGSPTQNHYDHVHVSFDSAADVHVTC